MILSESLRVAMYEAHRKALPNKRLDPYEELPERTRADLATQMQQAVDSFADGSRELRQRLEVVEAEVEDMRCRMVRAGIWSPDKGVKTR